MTDLPFTLDQLRILKAIASEGSFKKAAESLYISQPAVSLQVQNLEKQLSVPIFDRGNRKAVFTEEGKVLLRYGGRILSLCDESCNHLTDLRPVYCGLYCHKCVNLDLPICYNDKENGECCICYKEKSIFKFKIRKLFI